MLFCRTVLLSLIGSVWCATTPDVHWLRGRTRGISKTVQPDDHPLTTSVLRGDVLKENSTAWIGASADSDATKAGDIVPDETNTGDMFPPEKHTTTLFRTQGISKTVPTDDYHTSGEDLEVMNSTALIGASSSDSDETKTGDIVVETDTDDETVPPKKHTTALFRQTEDEYRTRRGIVLVDDDFNVSPPEPGVNEGWSDGVSVKTSSTIDEGSGQEEPPSSTPSPPDLDGSGDGVDPTEKGTNLICLNSTCDSREMFVYPGHDEIVPVGTNLTLSCVQSNESVVELRWYKFDSDGNPLLQQQNTNSESELTFAIPKSRTEDSGRYVCLRVGSPTGSCCHRTLHVKVYEVPNYRYHLIVVGVVAAVSLFACILIGMCKNYKTKKYEVQLELQNMESDCVYKM